MLYRKDFPGDIPGTPYWSFLASESGIQKNLCYPHIFPPLNTLSKTLQVDSSYEMHIEQERED
jgi:hypothetical protein